jgi:serine/threonine protein kinase
VTVRSRLMVPGMSEGRWIEVEPSQFAHEREALDQVRRALPDSDPWFAWSNVTFIDTNGRPSEVDLLVVAPRGVFLIEIKSYPDGELDAGAGTWVWQRPNGRRSSYDNPFHSADGKAKRLKSLLQAQKAFRRKGPTNAKPLWVEALVYLSSPDLRVDLDPRLEGSVLGPGSTINTAPVAGLPGDNATTTQPSNRLPGLVETLKRLDAHSGPKVNKPLANAIVDAMNQADIRQSEKYRQAGSYRLTEAIEEGDTWVDFRATHKLSRVDRRIRLHVHSRAADDDEKQAMQRAVEREFRLLSKLRHPAIESPVELVPNPRGLAQVYPYEPEAQRLDHWLADCPDVDLLDRLDLFRDIAEGVAYAHEHGLSHRSLSPRRVWVVETDGKPTARLRDWTTVARDAGTTATGLSTAADRTRHVTSFELLAGQDAAAYMAPELHTIPDADGQRADVFALGCLLHLLVSGRPPAEDGDGLRQLLDQYGHVPLSAALDQAPMALTEIVEFATQHDVAVRLDSVAELLA